MGNWILEWLIESSGPIFKSDKMSEEIMYIHVFSREPWRWLVD